MVMVEERLARRQMADSSASLASTELIEKWECFHPLMTNDITLPLKFKT